MHRDRKRKFSLSNLISACIRVVLWFSGLLLLGAAGGFALIYWFRTPDVGDLFRKPLMQTSVLYDRTGTHVLYELHGEENRKVIPHDQIPDIVRQATIATEDAHYYDHPGFDPRAIVRAAFRDIENGRFAQGGSTVTQQIARIFYLNSHRTLVRKLNEIVIAVKINRAYSKDAILDLYLNSIPYGSNTYGIEAASEAFFGKAASSLTADEAAFLAAMPKATTYYSPYRSQSVELVARQHDIIRRMSALGYVTSAEEARALATDTLAKVRPKRDAIVAPHFVFSVIDELRRKFGNDFLSQGGLRIITSLDADVQSIAEDMVARGAAANVGNGAENAALVAKDVRTGEILAMAGSRNYFDTDIDGQVNVALALRQPGSAFKPFVYAKAFEDGFEPESHILDAPVDFGPDGSGHDYIPRNYSGQFYGMLTMRQTLSMSLNVPAVQTLNVVGVQNAIDLARTLGITTLSDNGHYGLSLVLGGADVRLLDIVSAYSVFAADGIRRDPVEILRVERSGKTLYKDPGTSERVIDPEIARRIDSILSDNAARTPVFGPRSPLAFPGSTVAAKTGTTQEYRDAWTIGFTRSIAVGVWAGNNDNRPMKQGADGVFVAAPIWRDFMNRIIPRFGAEPFPPYAANPAGADRLISGGTESSFVTFSLSQPAPPESKKKHKHKK